MLLVFFTFYREEYHRRQQNRDVRITMCRQMRPERDEKFFTSPYKVLSLHQETKWPTSCDETWARIYPHCHIQPSIQ